MKIIEALLLKESYLPYTDNRKVQRCNIGIRYTGFSARVYRVTIDKIVYAIEWFYQKSVAHIDVYLELLNLGFTVHPHWRDWKQSPVSANWIKLPLSEYSLMWSF